MPSGTAHRIAAAFRRAKVRSWSPTRRLEKVSNAPLPAIPFIEETWEDRERNTDVKVLAWEGRGQMISRKQGVLRLSVFLTAIWFVVSAFLTGAVWATVDLIWFSATQAQIDKVNELVDQVNRLHDGNCQMASEGPEFKKACDGPRQKYWAHLSNTYATAVLWFFAFVFAGVEIAVIGFFVGARWVFRGFRPQGP